MTPDDEFTDTSKMNDKEKIAFKKIIKKYEALKEEVHLLTERNKDLETALRVDKQTQTETTRMLNVLLLILLCSLTGKLTICDNRR